jgi:hypothetical protein
MHLVFSAINTINNNRHQLTNSQQDQPNAELLLRYEAYQTACDKYSQEIAAIQKYIPGWLPKFR